MRRLAALVALLIPAATAAQAPAPNTGRWAAAQWQAAARGDVEAAYVHYRDNHPGVRDKNNPSFSAQLDRARNQALAVAAIAKDAAGYADALGAFSVGMADHHATLGARQAGGSQQAFQWPGFIPAWRGDALYVHTAEPQSGVSTGERVLGCDGLDAGALARKNLATSPSYPLTPGEYWTIGGAPFSSTETTAARRARVCRIEASDGAVRELTLQWRDAPADYVAKRALARTGDRSAIGLREPRPGYFLIGMPTFSPSETQVADYEKLFVDLAARRPALVSAKAVVIDLRHNQGGSSSWSQQAGRILWGDAAVDDWEKQSRDTAVWWRASAGNAAFVETWAELFRKQNRPDSDVAWAERVAKGLRAALGAKQDFFIETEGSDAPSAGLARTDTDKFATPVYVITHGQCGSACLDAVDLFRGFPNVRLIGSPTAADTNYMDIRVETLPSGLGQMTIPMKVYVGRRRASGASYTPDILMTGLDWSTSAFLDRIGADLSALR